MPDVRTDVPFPPPKHPKFTFIDLFAGIGGFHLAMHALGGKCVFASEWDKDAQATYEVNYGIVPQGDITKIDERNIPPHDVLCAGFPCQPFSKAGKQEGFEDETKGTLFFDIERILRYHHTKYIILENVRNLIAHDNGNTWRTIHSHLVNLGYRLTPDPLIVSPHFFGVPQLRERVVVLGVYDPAHANQPLIVDLPKPKSKSDCSLDTILERENRDPAYELSKEEVEAIDTWDEFYHGIQEKVIGFPIWLDWFKKAPPSDPDVMPEWKRDFVRKNNRLYKNNRQFIDGWLKRHNGLRHFTPTLRKMEWQCGDAVTSAWDAFMQVRPSGLRIKRPDCAPALVAIVQIPIIGKYRRRMSVREAARLQSFDDRFIPNPCLHQAYKQFGNAVNVEVIKQCAIELFHKTGIMCDD
ncbi:MAG: DNA cytosine methyltransferase [Kiritimatiellae bacterium]|nr:DNA cytosine methyltransferase [Kiritimatiellia bacterium]